MNLHFRTKIFFFVRMDSYIRMERIESDSFSLWSLYVLCMTMWEAKIQIFNFLACGRIIRFALVFFHAPGVGEGGGRTLSVKSRMCEKRSLHFRRPGLQSMIQTESAYWRSSTRMITYSYCCCCFCKVQHYYNRLRGMRAREAHTYKNPKWSRNRPTSTTTMTTTPTTTTTAGFCFILQLLFSLLLLPLRRTASSW